MAVEGVPMLADEEDPVELVENQDARRQVGEVDDAIDPGQTIRPDHLVMPDRDPRVLIGHPPGTSVPRPAGDGPRFSSDLDLVVHEGIVARGDGRRPAADG